MPKLKYKVRKDGRYTASVTIGKLPNGNPKRKYVYAMSPNELDKKIVELKNNYYKGTISDDSTSFETWAKKWYELNISQREYGTQKEITYLLNKYIFPSIGIMKIKEIKPYHIKELMLNMKNIPSTEKKVLQLIKRILADAIANDIIYKNIAYNIKSTKVISKEKKPLTLEEDKILLDTAKKHKYGTFILLMRYTGLRREEIVALTNDDVNLDKMKLSVNKAVTFIHNKPIVKSTKSKKPRVVDIPDILLPFLSKHMNNESPYLFTKQTNITEMLSESATKRLLESFLYACNKNRENKICFTFHQLRHSYCTMLYYAGIKIKKAQELMGHSSADLVYNIYTHLDEQRENSEILINNYISNNIYEVKM